MNTLKYILGNYGCSDTSRLASGSFIGISFFQFGQGSLICDDIEPFCSDEGLFFQNTTGGLQPPSGANYGCFSSQPNPAFFYMEIAESGPIQILIEQSSGDVDFAMWGPFNSYTEGCDLVMSGVPPIQQSYSTAWSETIGLGIQGGGNLGSSCIGTTTPPTPQVGEVYIVMVTNYSNQPGTISFTQTNSSSSIAGSTDCSIICSIFGLTYTLTDCDPVTNTFSISGSLGVDNPPENGLLVVEDCSGNSVSFSPPFDETLEFTLSDILANGADCQLTVTLYDYDNDDECVATSPSYLNKPDCHCDIVSFDNYEVNTILCFGDCDGEIGLFVENPHDVQIDYSLTDSEGNAVEGTDNYFNDLCQGVYSYTIGYAGDCVFTGNINLQGIPGVVINTEVIDAVCGDDGVISLTVSGGTPPYSYSWSPAVSTTDVAIGLGSGTYTITVTDANGCEHSVSETITEPDPPISHISTTEAFYCAEGTVQIETEGPGSGSFSATPSGLVISSDGTINLEESEPGEYIIVYSFTENTCEFTDTLLFTVVGFPGIDVANEIYLCEGETWTPNATGVNNISWSDGLVNGQSVSEPVGTHTYTVSGISDDGCEGEETVTVYVYPNPTVNVTADPVVGPPPLVVEFTNNSIGASDYTWEFGDGEYGSSWTDHHTYVYPGFYNTTVIGITDKGCVDSVSILIEVIFPEMEYEFPNVFSPNGDGVNDFFIIKYPKNISNLKVEVLNRWGTLVYEFDEATPQDMQWNGKVKNTGPECGDGIYFYKVTLTDLYGVDTIEHGFIHLNRQK